MIEHLAAHLADRLDDELAGPHRLPGPVLGERLGVLAGDLLDGPVVDGEDQRLLAGGAP